MQNNKRQKIKSELSKTLAKLADASSSTEELLSKLRSLGIEVKPEGSIRFKGCEFTYEWLPISDNAWTDMFNNSKCALQGLMEKVHNASDSCFLRSAYEQGIDPVSLDSAKDGIEKVLKIPEGDWSLASSDQVEEFKDVLLVSESDSASKNHCPNFTIMDRGEGLSKKGIFEKIFSNSNGSDKKYIKAVSGSFNRGGLATFLNQKELFRMQTILSRKQKFLQDPSDPFDDYFNFAVVCGLTSPMMKECGFLNLTKPELGGIFYLSLDGDIPHFKCDVFQPQLGKIGKKHKDISKFGFDNFSYGTIIRIFDYDVNRGIESFSGQGGIKSITDARQFFSAIKVSFANAIYPVSACVPLNKFLKGGRLLHSYLGLNHLMNLKRKSLKVAPKNQKYFEDEVLEINIPFQKYGTAKLKVYPLLPECVRNNSVGGFLHGLNGFFASYKSQWIFNEPNSSVKATSNDWRLGVSGGKLMMLLDLSGMSSSFIANLADATRENTKCPLFKELKQILAKQLRQDERFQNYLDFIDASDAQTLNVSNVLKDFYNTKKPILSSGINCQEVSGNGSNGDGLSNKPGTHLTNREVVLGDSLTKLDLITTTFKSQLNADGTTSVARKQINRNAQEWQVKLQGNARPSFYDKNVLKFEARCQNKSWFDVGFSVQKHGNIFLYFQNSKELSALDTFKVEIRVTGESINTFNLNFECQNVSKNSAKKVGSKNGGKKRQHGSCDNGNNSLACELSLKIIDIDQIDDYLVQEVNGNSVTMTKDHLVGFIQNGDHKVYGFYSNHSSYKKILKKISSKAYPIDMLEKIAPEFYQAKIQDFDSKINNDNPIIDLTWITSTMPTDLEKNFPVVLEKALSNGNKSKK